MNNKFTEQQLPKPKGTFFEDLWGSIQTTTNEPTYVPRRVSEQIVIWDDTAGTGDILLCTYDNVGKQWLGVTLTAL